MTSRWTKQSRSFVSLAKVERGLKQANEGKTVPHDEVKERLLG